MRSLPTFGTALVLCALVTATAFDAADSALFPSEFLPLEETPGLPYEEDFDLWDDSLPVTDTSDFQELPLNLGTMAFNEPHSIVNEIKLPLGLDLFYEDLEVNSIIEWPLDPETMALIGPSSIWDETTSPPDLSLFYEDPDDNILTGFPWDSDTVASTEPPSNWDETSSPLGVNWLYEDPEEDLFAEKLRSDLLELAYCSASEDISAIGKKARFRRRDAPAECKAPTQEPPPTTPPTGGRKPVQSPSWDFNPWRVFQKVRAAEKNPDHNTFCHVYTDGQYPWGVCPNRLSDVRRIVGIPDHWKIYYPQIGKLIDV